MTPFDFGQITQELANARIAHMLDCPFVETTGLELHHLDLLPDVIDAQRAGQPDRAPLDEALHVMPPDQGNMLAEAASVGLDQAGTMLGFLLAHLVEDLRGVGIGLPQTVGEIAVNTAVLLFQGNSQSQNLALGKLAEFLRHLFLFVSSVPSVSSYFQNGNRTETIQR